MLTRIKGIGEKTKLKYNKLGIFTPYDLLFTLPGSYADLTESGAAREGCYCKLDVDIQRIFPPFRKGKLQMLKARGTSDYGSVGIIWFNQSYIIKNIREGEVITVFGKLSRDESGLRFINPLFEKKTENSRFEGIKPVYFTKGLVSQRQYADAVKNALGLGLPLDSLIDPETERRFSLTGLAEAVKTVHMPVCMADTTAAADRLMLEKALKRLLAFRLAKGCAAKDRAYSDIDLSPAMKRAGFELTESQKSAVSGIINQLKNKEPLNAMLAGDVGSGKTVVAMLLCFFIVKNGYQAAMMAPTEVLARQHFERAERLFDGLGVRVRLLTASGRAAERKKILSEINGGAADIVIGTQALLNGGAEFKSLAFCVLDEQHRFGVGQRTALIEKNVCDALTMTATPIPRSLRLALLGDIECFFLEKRYAGNIKTFTVNKEKRKSMFEFILNQCKNGAKAFIVAPRIEDCEGVETDSAERLHKELTAAFGDIPVALLHGKMKEPEKRRILEELRVGKYLAAAATSVIEVGIDVPDVSIVAVMNAERFGLASLHQLRGRAGRNGGAAFCFFYSESRNERLEFLKDCDNGMKIAEYDFEIRGGGELFGTRQSGNDMRGITAETLRLARRVADELDTDGIENRLRGEIERNRLSDVGMT